MLKKVLQKIVTSNHLMFVPKVTYICVQSQKIVNHNTFFNAYDVEQILLNMYDDHCLLKVFMP